jgi:mono/diheme cytochrome c family protein
MRRHTAILLLSCIVFADGCFQLLDSGASSGGEGLSPPVGWDGGMSTVILPGSPEYGYVDKDGALVTSEDPCDVTRAQAMTILEQSCAGCHGGRTPGERAGNPPFDYVLDESKLTSSWSVNTVPPSLFVAAGSPMTSRLFLRIRRGEMPPAGGPQPTVSDISVLYEWISRCVTPPDDDADGGRPDGGEDDDDQGSKDAGSQDRRGDTRDNVRGENIAGGGQ